MQTSAELKSSILAPNSGLMSYEQRNEGNQEAIYNRIRPLLGVFLRECGGTNSAFGQENSFPAFPSHPIIKTTGFLGVAARSLAR